MLDEDDHSEKVITTQTTCLPSRDDYLFSAARRRKKLRLLLALFVLLAFSHPIAVGISAAGGLTMFGTPLWLGFLKGFTADILTHLG